MEPFSFFTIEKPSEGLYKESGSKFLSFAYPVNSEEDIKAKLAELRKKYFDASHHCFAWILGTEKRQFRAMDDGEPAHSAGDPILGQIRSKNLTNVLVVVVRYFGGTKLGVGGLIQAYKSAAQITLSNSIIILRHVTVNVKLEFDYEFMPEAMRTIKDFGVIKYSQEFTDRVSMLLEINKVSLDQFRTKIQFFHAMGIKITMHDLY